MSIDTTDRLKDTIDEYIANRKLKTSSSSFIKLQLPVCYSKYLKKLKSYNAKIRKNINVPVMKEKEKNIKEYLNGQKLMYKRQNIQKQIDLDENFLNKRAKLLIKLKQEEKELEAILRKGPPNYKSKLKSVKFITKDNVESNMGSVTKSDLEQLTHISENTSKESEQELFLDSSNKFQESELKIKDAIYNWTTDVEKRKQRISKLKEILKSKTSIIESTNLDEQEEFNENADLLTGSEKMNKSKRKKRFVIPWRKYCINYNVRILELIALKDGVLKDFKKIFNKLMLNDIDSINKFFSYIDNFELKTKKNNCFTVQENYFSDSDISDETRKIIDQRNFDLELPLKDFADIIIDYDAAYRGENLDSRLKGDSEFQSNVEEEEFVAKDSAKLTDVNLDLYYFKKANIALVETESSLLNYALKRLTQLHPIKSARFWGIIYGVKNDYVVAECEFSQSYLELNKQVPNEALPINQTRVDRIFNILDDASDYDKETSLFEQEDKKLDFYFNQPVDIIKILREDLDKAKEMIKVKLEENDYFKLQLVPKLKNYVPPPEPLPNAPKPDYVDTIPPEKQGEGVNKKVYFVTNRYKILGTWEELPAVTPQQIIIAKKINNIFTGNLYEQVHSYPAFPGLEINYLRAQIARISAGTHISPKGYFRFEEFEEGAEDYQNFQQYGAFKVPNVTINEGFSPLSVNDLVEQNLENWVHFVNNILDQGRVTFWEHKLIEEEQEIEEPLTGVDKLYAEMEKAWQRGPPTLTSCDQDIYLKGIHPFTVYKASPIDIDHNLAIVRSNLWPGAYTYGSEKFWSNIYIGNGLKYCQNYTPNIDLDIPLNEYVIDSEVIETIDPDPITEFGPESDVRLTEEKDEEGEAEEEPIDENIED